jgi:hypothetical protein
MLLEVFLLHVQQYRHQHLVPPLAALFLRMVLAAVPKATIVLVTMRASVARSTYLIPEF